MAQLVVQTTVTGDTAIVALAGECDLASREELTATLLAAGQTARHVVVDLAGLAFIDSTGIHSLVVAYHAAQERGGALWVRAARGRVATVLALTGVGTLLAPPSGQGGGRG